MELREELIRMDRATFAERAIHLDGKPFSLSEYPMMRAVYNDPGVSILFKCGRQVGKSVTLCNFLGTEMMAVSQFKTLFISPSKEQTSRFSNTRFAKMIFFSPLISKFYLDNRMPSNNVMLRMLANGSEITFSYAQDNAERCRGISADRLCVSGDTKLHLENGATVTMDAIVAHRMIGTRIITLNEATWELESKPIEKIFVNGISEVFEVTTTSGRRLKATAEHQVFTKDGWKPVCELTFNDWLAEPNKIPVIDVNDSRDELPEALLSVCGYLLGDGRHEKFSRVGLGNKDIKVIRHFTECLDVLGAKYTVSTLERTTGLGGPQTEHTVNIYGSRGSNKHGLKATLRDLGIIGQHCYTKRIPFIDRLVSERSVCVFLGALYATDGCICVSNTKRGDKEYLISYVSTSRDLSEEVQLLLLRLGIGSVLRVRVPTNGVGVATQFVVQIRNHRNAKRFLECLEIVGKEEKCRELQELLQSRVENKWRPSDSMPFLVEFRRLLSDAGISIARLREAGCFLSSSGNPERTKVALMGEITGIPFIKKLAAAPLSWERVVSVVSRGRELVYDIRVKDNHNFVANGLIAHNCLDEVQSIILSEVEPVVRECLAASKYKYRAMAGTPLTFENDIEARWQASSKNEWIVTCEHCSQMQKVDEKNLGDHFLMCKKCSKELNVRQGQWYSESPGTRITGYHISQLIIPSNVSTVPNKYTNVKPYDDILDKRKTYSRAKFNNEVLGESDALGSRLLSREELEQLCKEWYWEEGVFSNPEIWKYVTQTVAGVDWSGQGQENQSRTTVAVLGIMPNQKLRLMYAKIFNQGNPMSDVDEVARICDAHRAQIVIGDAGEGALANATLRNKLGHHRVFSNRYGASNNAIKWNGKDGYHSDRTTMIDQAMMLFKTQGIEFPNVKQATPFINDILAEYEESTAQGRRIWRHAASVPDDMLHSLTFAWLASKVVLGQVQMYSTTESSGNGL